MERFIGETERQFAIERFEFCIQSASRLRDHLAHHQDSASEENRQVLSQYGNEVESLLSCLRQLCRRWLEYVEVREEVSASAAYRVSQQAPSGRGRPRFDISVHQLEYLRSSWTDIAALLGVSRMTIFRRRVEFQMVNETLVEDRELRTIISSIRQDMPNVGEKMVLGRLRSMGYHVSRERVRHAIRATDPIKMARNSYPKASLFCSWPKFLVAYRYAHMIIIINIGLV